MLKVLFDIDIWTGVLVSLFGTIAIAGVTLLVFLVLSVP